MRLRSLEYRYVWAPALSHIRGSDGSSGGLESTSSSRPCESRDVFKHGKFLRRAAASYLGSRQPVASASTRAVCAAELECEQGQQLLRIVQLSPQLRRFAEAARIEDCILKGLELFRPAQVLPNRLSDREFWPGRKQASTLHPIFREFRPKRSVCFIRVPRGGFETVFRSWQQTGLSGTPSISECPSPCARVAASLRAGGWPGAP